MSTNLITDLTSANLRSDVPAFRAGDTIKVHVRVVEGGLRSHDDGVAVDRRSDVHAWCVAGQSRNVVDGCDWFTGNAGKHGGCRAAGHGSSLRSVSRYIEHVTKRADTGLVVFEHTCTLSRSLKQLPWLL